MNREEEANSESIDWDEFHPKSPYDVYTPRFRRRKEWSIILGVVLYLGVQAGAPIFLRSILTFVGVTVNRVSSESPDIIMPFTLWAVIIANVVAIVLVLLVVRIYYDEPISLLGFTTKNIPKAVLYGVVGYAVTVVVITSISYPIEQRVGVDPTQQALSESAMVPHLVPLLLLSGAIVAPIAEEVVFRGYLYKAFRERFKPVYAIGLNAALFSLFHFEPRALLWLFIIGIALAYVYEKTGNLVAPITLHMLNNMVAFLLST
ncbi:MAG TPA: CPBP family intramembrane glutamic endopeptidase [Candidatus Acidoferrales bacterium]|nr:CPBP family intramembrane glutamic endopeptidase [Candidatus Acidoferrales bacterium]